MEEWIHGAAGASVVGVPMSLFMWLLKSRLARTEQIREELRDTLTDHQQSLSLLRDKVQQLETGLAVKHNQDESLKEKMDRFDRRQADMETLLQEIRLDLKAHIAADRAVS